VDETNNNNLLSKRRVARELDVCLGYVDKLVRTGALPHIRIGRNLIRIHPADLAAFIEKQRVGSVEGVQ
jgi:excisionase family DNA binding protein